MKKICTIGLFFSLLILNLQACNCTNKIEKTEVRESMLIAPSKAKDAGDWEFPVVVNSGEFGISDTVKLSDVIKKPEVKVVLIHYWATWGEPTNEALPYLQEIYLSKKSEGLCPLVICIDKEKSLKNYIINFIKNIKWKKDGKPANITYTIPWDLNSKSKDLYGIGAIPVTFLVDKNNKIRYQQSGLTMKLIEDLKVAIDELLRETKP